MRNYKHVLSQSKSGKTVIFRVDIDDMFGKHAIKFASVSGWRTKLALKHLFFETEDWNDDVARKYVGMQVLRSAKNTYDALESLNLVRILSSMEVHFWANKFMINQKSGKAWRAMYLKS
jgi:hypothetical protein